MRSREALSAKAGETSDGHVDHWEARSEGQAGRMRDEGRLAIIERPAEYVERRDDGFEEPHAVAVFATAHTSAGGAGMREEMEALIKELQPDSVVVELCQPRAAALLGADAARWPGSWRDRLRQVLRPRALIANSLLGFFSALLPRLVGLSAPGEEAVAAARAAELAGVEVVCGDVPLALTLRRVMARIGPGEMAKLLGLLVSGAAMAVVKRGEASRLAGLARYPGHGPGRMADWVEEHIGNGLREALFDEREAYMAWVLKRSKAASRRRLVLGIFGAAHFDGIVKRVEECDGDDLRFKDLVAEPVPRGARGLFGLAFALSPRRLCTGLVWWAAPFLLYSLADWALDLDLHALWP